jgi:peptidoglycan biosynthesis protein MviN/MurJ (putative lipid II flippase)
MNTLRPLGIMILLLGAVLLAFGYHFSEAPLDQLTNALTGRYSNVTMWYIICGALFAISGGVLILSAKRF